MNRFTFLFVAVFGLLGIALVSPVEAGRNDKITEGDLFDFGRHVYDKERTQQHKDANDRREHTQEVQIYQIRHQQRMAEYELRHRQRMDQILLVEDLRHRRDLQQMAVARYEAELRLEALKMRYNFLSQSQERANAHELTMLRAQVEAQKEILLNQTDALERRMNDSNSEIAKKARAEKTAREAGWSQDRINAYNAAEQAEAVKAEAHNRSTDVSNLSNAALGRLKKTPPQTRVVKLDPAYAHLVRNPNSEDKPTPHQPSILEDPRATARPVFTPVREMTVNNIYKELKTYATLDKAVETWSESEIRSNIDLYNFRHNRKYFQERFVELKNELDRRSRSKP